MTEFVRVKLENGSEASVPAGFAKSHDLTPLKKPAADKNGRALPVKHKTTVAKAGSSTTTRSGSDDAATSQEVSK